MRKMTRTAVWTHLIQVKIHVWIEFLPYHWPVFCCSSGMVWMQVVRRASEEHRGLELLGWQVKLVFFWFSISISLNSEQDSPITHGYFMYAARRMIKPMLFQGIAKEKHHSAVAGSIADTQMQQVTATNLDDPAVYSYNTLYSVYAICWLCKPYSWKILILAPTALLFCFHILPEF